MKDLNWFEIFLHGIQYIAYVPYSPETSETNLVKLQSLVYRDSAVSASSHRLRV